jgi:hydrogenase maturation protein HypF
MPIRDLCMVDVSQRGNDDENARVALHVRGIVQGVGFRPFVHRLAGQMSLSGSVCNRADGVLIEVEGPRHLLRGFVDQITRASPARARIEAVTLVSELAATGDRTFRIVDSAAASPDQESQENDVRRFSADAAVCDDCLSEMNHPENRRFRYPFISCAACGPRMTIVQGAPYDRARTTMAVFPLCEPCRTEYLDPTDRRFHAQTIACPACGPRLSLDDAADPIEEAGRRLCRGEVLAVKGLGGYHLACDATSDAAVARLRVRKHRDEKPFAVMVRDLTDARRLAHLDPEGERALAGGQRPILLCRARRPGGVSAAVAPGRTMLGLLLPYTPLHHLLLAAVRRPLVMTSGNRSDEPIAYQDDDARVRLAGIADAFLTHDRRIHLRCDDSVAQARSGGPRLLRRSRGWAPEPTPLPFQCPRPLLATGGHLKNVFALGQGRAAVLSHHIGDLGEYAALRAFREAIGLYEALFACRPRALVHDLHPDYASTTYARERGAREGLPCLAVQHHHAHFASCLTEHGHAGPAIGVIFDGSGHGPDGTVWGGEFLIGDRRGFRRAAHLRPVSLPGGDRAAREPWRMALVHLEAAGVPSDPFLEGIAGPDRVMVRRLAGTRTPLTSSVGRLFDAAASLLGLCQRASYEAQAAMALEDLASAAPAGDLPDDYRCPVGEVLDPGPLIRALARDRQDGVDAALLAWRFHAALAAAVADQAGRLRDSTGLSTVALSGGVFANALLSGRTRTLLEALGFRVLEQTSVPGNDGGLALGQLAVAAARLEVA